MTDRELMQQALVALEYHTELTQTVSLTQRTIAALRERLAWRSHDAFDGMRVPEESDLSGGWADTAAPRREWQSLTDQEMRDLEEQFNAERVRTSDEEYLVIYPGDYWAWQRAIEAALKEKNA